MNNHNKEGWKDWKNWVIYTFVLYPFWSVLLLAILCCTSGPRGTWVTILDPTTNIATKEYVQLPHDTNEIWFNVGFVGLVIWGGCVIGSATDSF